MPGECESGTQGPRYRPHPEDGNASGVKARFESGAAGPHQVPRKVLHIAELSEIGGGQLPLVPELAQDHAVRKQSTTLQGTRARGEVGGSGLHGAVKSRPVFLNPRGGQGQIKA